MKDLRDLKDLTIHDVQPFVLGFLLDMHSIHGRLPYATLGTFGRCNVISQNVFINWFQKVNSPTILET